MSFVALTEKAMYRPDGCHDGYTVEDMVLSVEVELLALHLQCHCSAELAQQHIQC